MDSANVSSEDWQRRIQQMRRTAAEERHKNERLAQQLSKEAMQQWQRSIEGILALPTAGALSLAASMLYAAGFIERGFEMVQQSTEAMRAGLESTRREMMREANEEQSGDGGRGRSDANRGEANRGEAHA